MKTDQPIRFIPSNPLTRQSAADYVKSKSDQWTRFVPVASSSRLIYDCVPVINVSCILETYNDAGNLVKTEHCRDLWQVWEIPLTGNISEDIKPGTPVALYGEW